jgi:uncharacterized membrane protein YcfT
MEALGDTVHARMKELAMAKAERLQWVDLAKGLSIILVVMMHSAYGVGQEIGGTGVLHWIIAFATPLRMPEFFLISGLFLSQVIGRDWARYADRRVVHYFYFYALWALIDITVKTGLSTMDPVATLEALAWAIVEPHGVLWFIYQLAIFSLATKLLYTIRAHHLVVLPIAAVLQMLPIASGSGVVDNFAEFYVYFYAGYAFAPLVFRLGDWVQAHPVRAIYALVLFAIVNGLLVFSPGFMLKPDHTEIGYAGLPGVRLALAFAGALAVCVLAMLLVRIPAMDWLRWLGSKSIVVYLAFALPMAFARTVMIKLGFTENTTLVSIIVMLVALVAPLALYAAITVTGWGKFLFERPSWAHLPGTPGSRSMVQTPAQVPAE